MVAVIEHIQGHYDVQEVEFGRVYRWRPECVIAECRCGERTSLTAASTATCNWCGADLAVVFQEELAAGRLGNETIHPWRYAGHREEDGLPC